MRIPAVLFVAVILLVGAVCSRPAQTEDVASFYSRKTLALFIPTPSGGGFDLYSRTLMDFMRKYIPGQPTIVLQNMAGAGGLRAANYLFNVAPRDGTTIGMPLSNIPFTEALDPESAKYRSV